MFVHYMRKRPTLTVEECIKIVYVLLSSILYMCFYIFNTTLNVLCYFLSSEWLLGTGIF
jgi:hypothetical protein